MGDTTTIARGRLAYNSQFRYSIKPAGIALASTAMSGPDETLSVTGLVHGYGTLTLTTNAGSIDVELVVTPPHNTWTTMSPMPYPLVFTYAAVIEGRIYVLDNHGYVICYNPRTNTWDRSSGAHLKYCQERWWLNLGAIGGKLYAAFGGLYVTDEIPVEAYDPHADTWTVVSDSLPTGKDHSASGVINGKLYVVGGDGGQYLAVQAGVMEFSPVTSQWTDKITAPIERNNLGSAVIGEKLYAIGGYPATATNDFGPLRTVGVYDAASNTYSERPDLALPAARIGMGVGVVDAVIYVVGGSVRDPASASGYKDTAETLAYDSAAMPRPPRGSHRPPVFRSPWKRKQPMPAPYRSGVATAAVDRMLYVIGGVEEPGSKWSVLNQVYTP